MKKHWWLPNLAVSVLFFIFGIVCCKAVVNWPLLQLKYEVDVVGAFVSLISLLFTILAVYWAANFLDRRKEANRAEKELFIRRVEEVSALIETLSDSVSLQEIELTDAASTLKRISLKLQSIFKCFELSELIIDSTLQNTSLDLVSSLRNLLTNTPAINPQDISSLPIQVQDGVIHITNERKLLINASFDELKTHLFYMELAINKA